MTNEASFPAWEQRGFGPYLLPIIPPSSELVAGRNSKLPNACGKLPGVRLADGRWAPMKEWQKHLATPENLRLWESWGAGVGLQAACYPGFDVDCTDPAGAEIIWRRLADTFGLMHPRIGRAPKVLFPARVTEGARFGKLRDAFELNGCDHAVEFLARGQFYVLDGVHPKTGQPYHWPNGRPRVCDLPVLGDLAAIAAELL